MSAIDLSGPGHDSVDVELKRTLAENEMTAKEAEWSRRLRGLVQEISDMATNWRPEAAQSYMAKVEETQMAFAGWRAVASMELRFDMMETLAPGERIVARIERAQVRGQTILLAVPPGGWRGFDVVGLILHRAPRLEGHGTVVSRSTAFGLGADELAKACTVRPAGGGAPRPYVLGEPLDEGDAVVIELEKLGGQS